MTTEQVSMAALVSHFSSKCASKYASLHIVFTLDPVSIMAFVIWAEILASTCGPTMGLAQVTVFMTIFNTSKQVTSLMENAPGKSFGPFPFSEKIPGHCSEPLSFSVSIPTLFSLCSTSILLIERGAPSWLALSRQLRQSSYFARIIRSQPLHLCFCSSE